MRYYLDSTTLFIRGSFRAASTGPSGGIRPVSTLISQSVPADRTNPDPEKELELVATREGIDKHYFGLLTPVPVTQSCIFRYDFITVFITAGIHRETLPTAGAINIIICSSEGMDDEALLGTIMVATEAKTEALNRMDLPLTGTPGDAVISASEGMEKHRHAGRLSEVGRRVREAVLQGVPSAIQRREAAVPADRPGFFIFSRIKGEHWVEWAPQNCPYYPCHFEDQRCDYCYCPFYPCGDESLGQWATGTNSGKVWNCARCTLLHRTAVADYLTKFPGASREELIRRADLTK
jgi:adenosylcobinamide hydrolase